MQYLDHGGALCSDAFVMPTDGAVQQPSHALLTLAQWQARDAEAGTAVAIRLAADETVETIRKHLNEFAFIGLDFPVFHDGRHCSSAAILRGRLGYRGDIRALGDVRLDQLEQLLRCGFSSFSLAEGQDAEACAKALRVFSRRYQADWTEPVSIFRRRHG